MFTIIVQEKGGEQRRMVFNKAEVTFGRVQGNDIVLPKGNVSKRHARIVLKDGKFIIVDLKSTNGTYVNGRKITSPLVVKDSDKIYIGDFIVGVDESAEGGESPSESTTSPPGEMSADPPGRPPRPTEAMQIPPGAVMPPPSAGPGRTGPPPRSAAPISQPLPREIPAPPGARVRPGPSAPPPMIPPPAPPMAGPPMSSSGPISAPMQAMGPMGAVVSAPAAPAPMPTFAESAPAMAPMAPPAMAPVAPFAGAPMASLPPPIIAGPNANTASGPAMPANVVALPTDKKARPSAPVITARRVLGRSWAAPRSVVVTEPLDPKVIKMLDLQTSILERARAKLELDKVPVERLGDEELWQRAERAVVDMVETLDSSGELPKYVDQDALIKETLNEALGLGPLEDLLADDKVDEIIVDRRDRILVGKDGALRASAKAFSSDDVLCRVLERLVAPTGHVLDEAHPMVDVRLRDGSRITAAIPPVAPRGPTLLLRKASLRSPNLVELCTVGAMSKAMCEFLTMCVTSRRNILVCGGPASGRTTVVGALAQAAARGERIVSIEEVAELSIGRDEWISLETRPLGDKPIGLCQLLHSALRLRPDRLIVADVHGRETFELLTTLSSSIDGALLVAAGEGATPALTRLAQLARIDAHLGESTARELTANAVEIVVHSTRGTDGAIMITSIDEVVGTNELGFETTPLFQHTGSAFSACGNVPRFYAELEARGQAADAAIFR